jgi:hypothetical protein
VLLEKQTADFPEARLMSAADFPLVLLEQDRAEDRELVGAVDADVQEGFAVVCFERDLCFFFAPGAFELVRGVGVLGAAQAARDPRVSSAEERRASLRARRRGCGVVAFGVANERRLDHKSAEEAGHAVACVVAA